MKKRLLAALLFVVFLLTPSLGVVAHGEVHATDGTSYGDVGPGLWEEEYGEVYNHILDSILRGEEKIKLSDYKLTPSDLSAIYEKLYYSEAELFVISSSYSYTTMLDGNISALIPTYQYEASEIPSALSDFRERTDAIISEMPTGLSPLGRVIFLYDYLATHVVYDGSDANFDAYGTLVEGKGVCQGYALLLRYLLRSVGVAAECVTSDVLNHEWNIVKLGDAWYHLDVTWDDTDDTGELGQVDHSYFLLSDAAFMQGAHSATDWVSPVSASDTRYDGVFANVGSRFAFDSSGKIYAVVDDFICRYDETRGFLPLKRVDVIRHTGDGRIWTDPFVGLWTLSDKLLYNTENSICLYDPATGRETTLLSYVTSYRNYLYGCAFDPESGFVTLSFKTGANASEYALDTKQIAFSVTWTILGASYTESYVYGQMPQCKESTQVTDDRFAYTFLGWDKTVTVVTEDVVYTAEYEIVELFSESAKELLSLVQTAADRSKSLYERYGAISRAYAIKDKVDGSYPGVAEAILSLDLLASAYNDEIGQLDEIFAGWVPVS